MYRKEELLAADEVFLTNSIQEIIPVTHLDDVPIRHSYGPVTRQLRFAYRRSVELRGQLWYAIDNMQEGDRNGEA
jgi:4-amino-4-deoxychorismate lyase